MHSSYSQFELGTHDCLDAADLHFSTFHCLLKAPQAVQGVEGREEGAKSTSCGKESRKGCAIRSPLRQNERGAFLAESCRQASTIQRKD